MLCSYQSSFKPPTFLRPAWIQTTLPALLRTREHSLPRQDEILELSDGDSLELAWFNPRHEAGSVRAIAIITHGLEGSINSSYVVGLTKALSQIGCLTLAWNMRGCGGRPNKLLSWYHSGKSDDLKAVIDNASRRYPELPIVLIGVSVGGNILCKYLGEQAQDVPSRILASVAISAPLDLRGSALCLARWSRRIYMEYLLRPLRARVREKARLFAGLINADGVESITDFYEFDRRYTAPLHGFESVDHYWDTCSGARYLSSVRTPLRLISALDDPFLSPGCFPFQEASRSKWITIETPKRGGHVGFIDSLSISQTWLDRRVCEVVSPLL